MEKRVPFVLICLLTSAILIACQPSQAGPPTYSEVLRTYPKGVELCKTVASLEAVGQGGSWLLDGDVEYRASKALIKCYGTKITLKVPVTLEGKTYPPGTKLTVDKNLHWIEVSSWD